MTGLSDSCLGNSFISDILFEAIDVIYHVGTVTCMCEIAVLISYHKMMYNLKILQ